MGLVLGLPRGFVPFAVTAGFGAVTLSAGALPLLPRGFLGLADFFLPLSSSFFFFVNLEGLLSGTSSSSDNEDSEDDDDDDVDGDDNAGLDLREVEVVVEVAAARRAPGLVRYSFGYALTEDVTPWEGL